MQSDAPVPSQPSEFPVVDIHCHAFNADDIPVRGFVHAVGLKGAAAGYPLAQLVDALIQGKAPGYEADKARLDQLLVGGSLGAAPGLEAALPTAETPDQLERELDAALLEVQSRDPSLLLRVGAELVATERNLGAEEAQLEDLGDIWAAARRGARWVKLFGKSRVNVVGHLLQTFGDEVDVYCPLLVDMGIGLGDVAQTTMRQQMELHEKINRLSILGKLPGGSARLHPFIGFDPRREAKARSTGDPEKPLDLLRIAVEQYGFVGVKVYPPMGWRPIGNTEARVPFGMTEEEARLVDESLHDLYAWCEEKHIPITAHCNPSNFAHRDYRSYAGPEHWAPVLERYEGLRLNLGHFGTGELTGPEAGWPWDIARLASRFANVYVDVGNHPIHEGAESEATMAMLERMFADPDTEAMQDRVMYGSDWFMLVLLPDHESFLASYCDLYANRLGSKFGQEVVTKFLGGNALAFLGFDDVTNENLRRTATRYEEFAPDGRPSWLADE